MVIKDMVHGPYVGHFSGVPCVQTDGFCSKRYPRVFASQTTNAKDSYPTYRRRSPDEDGQTAQISRRGVTVEINNRWIVPHSPFLLAKFDCHCNVEICNSVCAVKYLFKNVCKGQDRAMVTAVRARPQQEAAGAEQPEPVDEIQAFQDGRCIGESEARWRLCAFDIVDRFLAVINLAVHPENKQPVFFEEGEEEQAAVAGSKATTLMAVFALNAADGDGEEPAADTLLYADVPRYFVWMKTARKWKRRARVGAQSGMNGRIPGVSPAMGDVYYLRMLLYRVRGSHTFADFRTYEGVVYPTFKAACLARSMLTGDDVWDSVMTDSTLAQMPVQLRHLFACLLVHCQTRRACLTARHESGRGCGPPAEQAAGGRP